MAQENIKTAQSSTSLKNNHPNGQTTEVHSVQRSLITRLIFEVGEMIEDNNLLYDHYSAVLATGGEGVNELCAPIFLQTKSLSLRLERLENAVQDIIHCDGKLN